MDNLEQLNENVARVATEKAQGAVDAAKQEISASVEAVKTELSDAAVETQKSIDEINTKLSNMESFAIGKKRTSREEMSEVIKEGVAALKEGDKFKINTEEFGIVQKDFDLGAGATSDSRREGMVGDIKYDPNYQTRTTNFLPMYSLPGNGAIRYNQETTTFTDNTSTKAEGASGANAFQSNVQNVQPVIENANTVGTALTLPIEWMDEVTGIDTYVTKRLMGLLLDEVDNQIISGNGTAPNWKGLESHTPAANVLDDATTINAFLPNSIENAIHEANNFDALTAVAATLEGDNWRPDLVLMNPVDYRAFSWIKSTQAEYVINQALMAATPFSYFNGLRIVPNPAVTAGEFILVDSSAVGVFMSKGYNLEFGYNDDDFLSHNITAKATLRGGVAGFRPNAIVHGTFSALLTELEDA